MLRRKEISDPDQHQFKLDVPSPALTGWELHSQWWERFRAAPGHSLAPTGKESKGESCFACPLLSGQGTSMFLCAHEQGEGTEQRSLLCPWDHPRWRMHLDTRRSLLLRALWRKNMLLLWILRTREAFSTTVQ